MTSLNDMPDAAPPKSATGARVLIAGNSHVAALRRGVALLSPPDAGRIETLWVRGSDDAKHGEVSVEDAIERIRRLAPTDRLVVSWNGTLHNVAGLLNAPERFTFARAERNPRSVEDGATIIPEGLVGAFAASMVREDGVPLRLAREAPCPVAHLMAPPPKRDVEAKARARGNYRGVAIDEVGFAAPRRRLAFWHIEREAIARRFAELGVGSVDIPETVFDASGYLDPRFHANDITHGNADYGALLLRAMLDEADRPVEAASDGAQAGRARPSASG